MARRFWRAVAVTVDGLQECFHAFGGRIPRWLIDLTNYACDRSG